MGGYGANSKEEDKNQFSLRIRARSFLLYCSWRLVFYICKSIPETILAEEIYGL